MKGNEIPEFWNQQYKKHLDIDVKDDNSGALQDVHWSHGSFGYFPTYSLGSFYASQFFSAAKTQLGNLDDDISNGNFLPLLNWLRKNIHGKGRTFTSEELCLQVTGKTLDVTHFTDYILQKYQLIY